MEITFGRGRRAPAVGAQCRLVQPVYILYFRYSLYTYCICMSIYCIHRIYCVHIVFVLYIVYKAYIVYCIYLEPQCDIETDVIDIRERIIFWNLKSFHLWAPPAHSTVCVCTADDSIDDPCQDKCLIFVFVFVFCICISPDETTVSETGPRLWSVGSLLKKNFHRPRSRPRSRRASRSSSYSAQSPRLSQSLGVERCLLASCRPRRSGPPSCPPCWPPAACSCASRTRSRSWSAPCCSAAYPA